MRRLVLDNYQTCTFPLKLCNVLCRIPSTASLVPRVKGAMQGWESLLTRKSETDPGIHFVKRYIEIIVSPSFGKP